MSDKPNNHLLIALCVFLLSSAASAERHYQVVPGADDVPLNVVTAGNPEHPAIVFIHGIGQSHLSFLRQLDSDLVDDHYLVSYDLRGHGGSGKPFAESAYSENRVWAEDLQAVIDQTGAKRPVIVAWSYGTLVLADYVRQFSTEHISGINLAGSYAAMVPMTPPDDPEMIERFMALRALQTSDRLEDNIEAALQFVNWMTAEPLDDATRLRYFGASMMLPRYARQAMSKRKFDNKDLVEHFDVPVLISRGDQDPSTPEAGASVLAAVLPNVTLSAYAGVGHSTFYERAERFNDELRQFVQTSLAIKD